ncbi:MAG: Succinyl-CoA ligase [ADP-forming] alpha chain, partial [uncultured Rubrobacteraceae bacterium]
ERPGRHEHEAVRLRHHRPGGHLPRAEQPALRHAGRLGRHPRQGGPGRRRDPRLQHLPQGRRGDRGEHRHGVRAAALRCRLHPRGGRRGHRDDHLHHRGHPRPRRAAGLRAPAAPARRAPR